MPNYTEQNTSIFKPNIPSDRNALDNLRKQNNPDNEAVGPYTGRCSHCGSNDLWEDNLAYGCNSCKAWLGGN
jgi:hypothetical protein